MQSVVKKYLGHLPGEIMVVHFDGMGPTWTQLVERGIEKYPEATHGIIADADFTPINGFDKRQLDRRCQKHMFTITTDATAGTARRMDWIYRNLKGAKVERRTHQTLVAPVLDPQQWGGRCPAKVHGSSSALWLPAGHFSSPRGAEPPCMLGRRTPTTIG